VTAERDSLARATTPRDPVTSLDIGRRVVAVVDDELTAAALRAGLASLGGDFALARGTVRDAIRMFEKEMPPQSLIVDIAGVENPRAALDDLARVCPPYVRVFVIGETADISFYRLLVRDIGVSEYLTKPVTRDVVLSVLLPHLAGVTTRPSDRRGGHLVVVCGARGGVGTSSIALNLAYAIMTSVKGHVALLDLHVQGGEIALMAGAQPGPGLRTALEDATRVDPLFLDRASIALEPRLRLIASEDAFGTRPTMTEAGVARVIDLLQAQFNFIIADLPMPPPPAMMRAVAMARQVVTVLTPDVASLRDTQNIRQVVADAAGADRMISVLNRADMKGGIERTLIDKALGGAPDVSIPELGRGMLEAINLGVPAINRVPSLRRHLAPLVREIAGIKPPAADASWWQRMFGR
jgi:pilus assembly protein CpaE